MYLFKLVQYLKHFKGRFAVSIDLSGPQAPDHETAMAAFRRALGLPDDVALGDRVKLTPDGVPPIEGTVDHLSKDFIGVLSDDAIYRFIHGFIGPMMVGHHIFDEGADKQELEAEWRGWLDREFASLPSRAGASD
jgi:hypothetical protein